MNKLLQQKLDILEKSNNFECWYLVKQPTDFCSICYLVSLLKLYKDTKPNITLQNFISEKVPLINEKAGLSISDNYRALLVASYFGLITKTAERGSQYEDSDISPTFNEIEIRCNGQFEKKELYNDIIQRQLEKIFISTPIDDQYQGIREKFSLYPVIFLYKILYEIGITTGNYSITTKEYNYLVDTATRYEDFLDVLLLIKLFREDLDAQKEFSQKLENKFDNRLRQALKQLDTLLIENDHIYINSNKINSISEKLHFYETHKNTIDERDKLDFLQSTENLFNSKEYHKTPSSPEQIIYYGVPGSGKSYKIDQKINAEYLDKNKREEHTMRVVFHPEYTNADFVGQIMPSINNDGAVEYKFTPGPFAQILRSAYLNPSDRYFLIIEEINRGNAAAIFGDIFQLLDRLGFNETDGDYSTGWSKYSVNNDFINWYIRETVYKNDLSTIDTTNVSKVGDEKFQAIEIESRHFSANTGIRLPSNLSLYATMNTSDQNVFTLDNAFQRRWDMELVENKFLNQEEPTKKEKEAAERQASAKIEGTKYTWEQFHRCINSIISEKGNDYGLSSMEDKRLGCWFVKAENGEIKKSVFSNKVLKYLWDDAFKFCRQDIFESDIKDFEQLRNKFLQLGEKIFSDASGIRQKLESEEKDQTITNEPNSQSTESSTEISNSQE